MIHSNWWWIGDVGHWLVSATTVLLAFWLGLRARKPRLKITVTTSTDKVTVGSGLDVMIHNSGSEAAYVRSVRMNVFGLNSSAHFFFTPKRNEDPDDPIPANAVRDYKTSAENVVKAWSDLPDWKKSVAAAVRYLPITVTVQDAGGNAYKGVLYYPWRGENRSAA